MFTLRVFFFVQCYIEYKDCGIGSNVAKIIYYVPKKKEIFADIKQIYSTTEKEYYSVTEKKYNYNTPGLVSCTLENFYQHEIIYEFRHKNNPDKITQITSDSGLVLLIYFLLNFNF